MMSAPRRRLLSLLALALAAAGVAGSLSGCASTSATLDPVAQAAEVTSAAGGVQFRFHARLSLAQLGSLVSASGAGFFNYAAREGRLAIQVNGLPGAVAGAVAAALGTGAPRIEEILKQGTAYVGSPLLAAALPRGAHWVKLDLSKLGTGLGLAGLTGGASNPAQFLEYLRAHGGSVTTVGSETVDGVHTTHYRGSIDLQDVVKELPAPGNAVAQSVLEQMRAQTGVPEIPFDAWVDNQHRIRRMQTSFSLDLAGQQETAALTIDFSRYGSTPTVTAPSATEVAEAPTSIPGLAG